MTTFAKRLDELYIHANHDYLAAFRAWGDFSMLVTVHLQRQRIHTYEVDLEKPKIDYELDNAAVFPAQWRVKTQERLETQLIYIDHIIPLCASTDDVAQAYFLQWIINSHRDRVEFQIARAVRRIEEIPNADS